MFLMTHMAKKRNSDDPRSYIIKIIQNILLLWKHKHQKRIQHSLIFLVRYEVKHTSDRFQNKSQVSSLCQCILIWVCLSQTKELSYIYIIVKPSCSLLYSIWKRLILREESYCTYIFNSHRHCFRKPRENMPS